MTVKRILIASGVLAVVGAVAPWNGSAGAAVPDHGDTVPVDRADDGQE